MKDNILLWAPRVVGFALTLFLAAFATDSIGKGPITDTIIHLAPALLTLAVVAVAWHRPLVGAVAFLALAAGYAAMTPRRPDWILAISGPLALAAALYLISWRMRPLR